MRYTWGCRTKHLVKETSGSLNQLLLQYKCREPLSVSTAFVTSLINVEGIFTAALFFFFSLRFQGALSTVMNLRP